MENEKKKMCKLNKKSGLKRIDPCIKELVKNLKKLGVRTLSSCCGHGKYPSTLVVDIGFSKILPLEIFSGIQLEGKKYFYKKDKQGYYYIPEVSNEK